MLVVLLAGRREEFELAVREAAPWVLVVTALLQIVALVSRSEAWHLTIDAAGGEVSRRWLYRASSMQVLGSVVNGQLGVAARRTATNSTRGAASCRPAEVGVLLPTDRGKLPRHRTR